MHASPEPQPRLVSSDWRRESRRSLLAWIRTGLSLMVVGSLLSGLYLTLGGTTPAVRLLPWIGAALVGLGVISVVGAMIGYRRARTRRARMSGASEAATRIVAGLIAIAGSLLIIIFIADAC